MLKNIVKKLKPSSTLKINEISRELESKGQKIFKFGFGQSPFQIPLDIVNELKSNAHQNKYLPMQGLKDLREVVAKYTSAKKDHEYTAENVIIGPGSKELMFLLHVIFDGEIILPAPSWVSYAPQAILGRNKIQAIQTKREKIWQKYKNTINDLKTDKFYLIEPIKKSISAYHILALVFKDLKLSNIFKQAMQKNNIAATFHYVPLHKSKMGKYFCKYKLPVTEKIFNRIVRLPLFSDMTNKEFNKISEVLKKFAKKYF